MPLALTQNQKLGLAIVAAIYIAFALVSSFVLPRRNPDYPTSRGLPVFVAATIVLFVGMMSAMFFLAREEEEERGREHGALRAGEPVVPPRTPSFTEAAVLTAAWPLGRINRPSA